MKAQPVALDAAEVVADAVRDLQRAVLALRPVERPRDVSPAVRARGAWLLTVPGAAAEFKQRVPADHLEDDGATVRCVCGARIPVAQGDFEECHGPHADGLWRCFLRSERSVWVARWEPCEIEDRYAGGCWTAAA